jgi:hypothetical protein
MPVSAATEETCVVTTTTNTGLMTNEISVRIMSSANAARRSPRGTSAARTWRPSMLAGTASNPAGSASAREREIGQVRALTQNTVEQTPHAAITRRSPYRSIILPATGEPTALPTVTAAATRPASAYPRPSPTTTCSVMAMPMPVIGSFARNITRMVARTLRMPRTWRKARGNNSVASSRWITTNLAEAGRPVTRCAPGRSPGRAGRSSVRPR